MPFQEHQEDLSPGIPPASGGDGEGVIGRAVALLLGGAPWPVGGHERVGPIREDGIDRCPAGPDIHDVSVSDIYRGMGELALVVEADGARNVIPIGAREDAVPAAYSLQEVGNGGFPFGRGPGGLPKRRELGEVLAFPVVVEAGDDVKQRVRVVLVFGKILPQIGLVDFVSAPKEQEVVDKAEIARLDPERGECPPVEHERLLVEHQAVQGPFPVRGEDHIDGVRVHRAPHMVDLHKPLAETPQQVNHGADPLLNDAYRRPFPWGWPRCLMAALLSARGNVPNLAAIRYERPLFLEAIKNRCLHFIVGVVFVPIH